MRDIVHQARAPGGPKTLPDLVQKERRRKGLRVIVHQARALVGPKTLWDLVHRKRSHKVLRDFVTKPVPPAGRKPFRTWCNGNGGTGFCG